MFEAARSRISNAQPQLVREIKGRWQGRNLGVAVATSLLGQLLIYLGFKVELPSTSSRTNRYCIGNPPLDELSPSQFYNPPNHYCLEDTAGNLVINWQLWWLDLFTWLTIFSLFVLLVAGTYLLISDLSKEEQRGTLNFVRLSPRSVTNILVGKLLGVPILVYTVILLAFPLHLSAGLAAGIPVGLLGGLYLVIIASCAFFYSLALLWGLVTTGLGNFQAWLGTGVVFFFLLVMTKAGMYNVLVNENPSDWLALFYPGRILPYLIGETPHSLDTIGYFHLKEVIGLKWYGLPIWNKACGAIALLIINYAWWTSWVWEGLQRRFRNPHATLLSKERSYWLTGSITVSLLGFMAPYANGTYNLRESFQIFLGLELVVFLLLIVALSPHRQTLQDWARYRHQKQDQATRNLLLDLVKGEQSPANGAIALNLLSNLLIITPALILFPLGSNRFTIFATVLLTGSAFLMYACLAQLLLLMKTPKRSLFAIVTISSVMFLPTVLGGMLQIPAVVTVAFFPLGSSLGFSAIAVFWTLLAQWVIIAGCSLQLTRQLREAGESSTKALFSEQKVISRT
jgi:hypothetical protein